MKPAVTLAPVKPILRIPDVCDLLGLSERQFHRLRPRLEERGLLQSVLPPIDDSPRFHGAPFVEWLSDARQQRELRALLERAS